MKLSRINKSCERRWFSILSFLIETYHYSLHDLHNSVILIVL